MIHGCLIKALGAEAEEGGEGAGGLAGKGPLIFYPIPKWEFFLEEGNRDSSTTHQKVFALASQQSVLNSMHLILDRPTGIVSTPF